MVFRSEMVAYPLGKTKIFTDRRDAGRRLAEVLEREFSGHRVHVLGLPRGGVPVAYEVAIALEAPLDVLVVRKLGAPFNPELAAGAVAAGGITVFNEPVLSHFGLTKDDLADALSRQRAEVDRREKAYRGDRPFPALGGTTALLIDDGIATGATMHAAVDAVQAMQPAAVIVAVPTAAQDSLIALRRSADRVIALATPDPYLAVGAYYEHFQQLQDAEVKRLLESAWARPRASAD